MYLIELLDNLFIQPLLIICEYVFTTIHLVIPSTGLSIALFSVVINLALMPVYYQMERSGRLNKQNNDRLRSEVARIKAHYKGRERYYYIRTLYRQFGYKPWSAIFSSTDLLLQILVFATVYSFLSHNTYIMGSYFGIIEDLGEPDRLFYGFNLLPFIMTVLNIFATVYYTQDPSRRRNAYLLSAFFLVLLYSSPSGLVLYWTCNNAFSLIRNFVEKKFIPLLPVAVNRLFSRLASQS